MRAACRAGRRRVAPRRVSPAIRIVLTSSGANSPCSTTPGVALSRSAELARDRRRGRGSPRSGRRRGWAAASRRRACRARRACRSRRRRPAPAAPAGEPRDGLLGRGDHDEAPCRRGDDLLVRVRPASALDQPSRRVDLVGAVDREVQLADLVGILDPQAKRPGGVRRGGRGRDAAHAASARARRAPAAAGRRSFPCPAPGACRRAPSRPRRLCRRAASDAFVVRGVGQ